MDNTVTKVFYLTLLIKIIASERKGFVSEVLEGKKFDCPEVSKKVYTVKSEIQCTHRCLQNDKCWLLNYNTVEAFKENCEVFSGINGCSTETDRYHWKAMRFQKSINQVYRSCKDIYNADPSSASGVYDLEIGRHHCLMERPSSPCGEGGWTLALKADGTKTTMRADSSWWTNDAVYNVDNGLKSFHQDEAKFSAFNELGFDDVCIGIKVSTEVRWLRVPGITKKSLRSIFNTGAELPTSSGRGAWKGLISSSSLQLNCNKEGFNLKYGNTILLRLGYVANEQNNCGSCDSFIGVGPRRGWQISCGNIAAASPDNGNKNTPAMCYLLIK